ncbi:hypothetical protein RJ639_016079 [Escallonia herrerae]|uniref:NB-ARC domain-containing protein n=1 Tax=Escallonia herrerae TaxID=1293975 RepID=A0AA89ALT6_9ASTE|nr:hypothetical protein RJ639_016079 [Escallonia herrerae]
MKKDLEGFLEDKIQNKAHGVCCKVPFPNCYYRFKLSRKASKKSVDVAELVKKGEPFKKRDDGDAHLARLEDSRLLSVETCVKFDSRSKIFCDILVALRDSNVTRVGIHGMPGVGKTTMVEEIRRALVLNKEFEEVAVVSATLDVKSIQRKLASGLGLSDLDKEDDESTRAGLLRRRLKNGKKILIILDDVWCKLPLADIGIDFGDSKGCKIFMTSRERRVCEANKCMSFLIDILSKEEAWSLFREHAGNCVDYPDISPVSEIVFNECGRLPLIIRAVGEALKDGDLFEWKDAQGQFESCTPHMIANIDDQAYKTLELSFNKLKPEEAKSCLLLCSLFPEDAVISIDEVSLLAKAMGFLPNTDSIEDARNRALSLVKTVKTSCLLQECEDGDSVKLHDVIRDVSVHVASEDVKYRFMLRSVVSAWPEIHEARRAISLRIETTLELPRKLECPQLQTLMLNSSKNANTHVPDTFFDGLENLTVLSLRNIYIYISSLLILPNLLMLYMRIEDSFNLSMLKELKKLEILILACSYLHKLPLDLRELKNLRLLDLRGCHQLWLTEDGVLSSPNHLEELYLPSCFRCWDAALVDELNSLTRLTALGAPRIDFDNLPDYQFCKKLIRYDITVGHNYSTRSVTEGLSRHISSTRTIDVGSINLIYRINLIDPRDAAKVLIEGAEKLFLTVNGTVKNLFYESSRDGFPHLKSLEVSDCEGMEYLVKWTPLFKKRSFSKLEVLAVRLDISLTGQW